MKFIKTIEAFQFKKDNLTPWGLTFNKTEIRDYFSCKKLNDVVTYGDWIVQKMSGEFYIIPESEIKEYEKVERKKRPKWLTQQIVDRINSGVNNHDKIMYLKTLAFLSGRDIDLTECFNIYNNCIK